MVGGDSVWHNGVPTFLPPKIPAKPGKGGLSFPSQAVSLTPSGQYDTNKAKLEISLPFQDMTRFQHTRIPNNVTHSHRFPLTSLSEILHAFTHLSRKSER
jgi:hypothetical protein